MKTIAFSLPIVISSVCLAATFDVRHVPVDRRRHLRRLENATPAFDAAKLREHQQMMNIATPGYARWLTPHYRDPSLIAHRLVTSTTVIERVR